MQRLHSGATLGLVCLLAAAPAWAEEPAGDLSAALSLYREGRCEEAVPVVESALVRHPQNRILMKVLGNCLLKAGRWDEARAQFEQVLRVTPEDEEARRGLEAAMSAIQEPVQARQTELFESRVAAEEQLETNRDLRRSEKLIAEGRDAEARMLLARIVIQDPSSLVAVERLAQLHSTAGRFVEAARLYRHLHRRSPDRSELLLWVGRNLEWAQRPKQAIEAYRSYLERNPGDDDAHLALADAQARFGLCADSLPIYEDLATRRPDDSRVHLGRAICLDQLGESERAIDAFSEVLRLDPDNEVATKAREERRRDFDERHLRRAFAALEEERLDDATGHLLAHLETFPDDLVALRELAQVYSWNEEYGKAERAFHDYLDRMPDDYPSVRALALTQMWAGEYAAAADTYQTLIASGHGRKSDYEQLTQCLRWGGQLDGAEPWIEALLEMDPENREALTTLAELRTRQALERRTRAEELASAERFDQALEIYEEYLEKHGPDLEIELRICQLHAWAGKREDAVSAYRTFLDRYPDHVQARLALANELRWGGQPGAAEPEYRRVLAAVPEQLGAIVGLAEALAASGGDPFTVRDAYRRALELDPGNEVARKGLARIEPSVRPTGSVTERGYFDSDDLDSSRLTLATRFRFPGDVSLTPYYRNLYYSQLRPVPGEGSAIEELNRRIAAAGGKWKGHGIGAGVELGIGSQLQLEGGLGVDRYSSEETTLTGRLGASLRLDRAALTAGWERGDAVEELLTVASLAGGLDVRKLSGSAEAVLPGEVRVWAHGGLAWYAAGDDPGLGDAYQENRQYRVSIRADRPIGPVVRAGYAFRQTGFSLDSPLHFSPERYVAHSLWLSASRDTDTWGWSLDAELGKAQVDDLDSTEWQVAGGLFFRISSRLLLRATYRAARSQTGLETGQAYRSNGLDVGLEKTF